MQKLLLSLAVVVFSINVVHATDWTNNYKAALDQAQAEHKLVLLDFTGNDPYGYGRMLDKQVLTQPTFKHYADKTFILVMVDLSTSSTLPDNLKQQNNSLARQFHVDGFPTLVAINSHEKELGRVAGYDPAGGSYGVVSKLKTFSQN